VISNCTYHQIRNLFAGTIFGHAHGPCPQIFSPFISLDSSTLELLTCDEDVNSHFSARDVKVLGFWSLRTNKRLQQILCIFILEYFFMFCFWKLDLLE
jgi:hypothetical protein